MLSLSMSIMVSLEVEPFAVMRRGSHERGRLPGVIGWFFQWDLFEISYLAVAGAECNTVIELKPE
ncbi:hypothetical protein VVF07_24820, partial [Pseudomonas aeruginosa]|uniref:hypothetical protein n=1 Tax=Pseudomonas aeruginosa TaxID=287 RepID=UPI003008070A